MAPGRGQKPVQFTESIFRQFAKLAAGCDQSVRGQHARPSAIGQDREPVTNLLPRQRQGLGGIEQFRHRSDPQHAGSAKHRVVDRIGARNRAGMRGGGACTGVGTSRFQYQDGFDARSCPRRGHEFAAVGNGFGVEQDGMGVRIGGEVVEHVAKINIAMSPNETTCEKPMPRGTAQSSIAVIIAPDWLTNAMCPTGAAR